MTTKRTPRRRTDHLSAMLAAWETYMWNGGVDWFHELERLGLDADEIERQAPRAWREHAQRFMAVWLANYRLPGLPYGAKRWGLPDGN
jgi:hypothetical protein